MVRKKQVPNSTNSRLKKLKLGGSRTLGSVFKSAKDKEMIMSFSKYGNRGALMMVVVGLLGLGMLFPYLTSVPPPPRVNLTRSAGGFYPLLMTEPCPNTIMSLLLEVYQGKMYNLLEEVEEDDDGRPRVFFRMFLDYLDSPPLEDSEIGKGSYCQDARVNIWALAISVGALREQLPKLFYLPALKPRTYGRASLALMGLYQISKDKVFVCRCEYYCKTNPGTRLSKKAMKTFMPPQNLTKNLVQARKQLPPGSELAFPIDAVDMYYNLPIAECVGWDEYKDGRWSVALEMPELRAWKLYGSVAGRVVVAHHEGFKKMLLFDEKESAGCIKYNFCKLPTRESAYLGEKQRRCVISALDNNVEFFPRCIELGAD